MTHFYQFLEWLLEIPPSGPGQGTSWRYGSDFPWADWVLLLFLLAAIAFVVVVYRRDAVGVAPWKRWLLIALRLGAIAVLLFMLSSAFLSVDRTGLPFAVVILDNSPSMTVTDPYQEEELRKQARELLREAGDNEVTPLNVGKAILLRDEGEFLKQMLENHKLRIYKISGAAVEVAECVSPADVDEALPRLRELEAEGDRTQLGKGLRTVLNELRGAPPSAIVLLTDGITTEGEKLSAAAVFARRKGVPVFPVGLGDSEPVRDLEIADVQVDEVAFVNDPITFLYTLSSRGYKGKRVSVTLRDEATGRPLKTERITLDSDERTQKLELTFTPHEVGEFDFVVEVQQLPKEANRDNNRQVRHVSVRKERIRVLLVDSMPRYEFKFLKTLLEREKTIELKTVLQDADPDYVEEDRTALQHFPVNEDDLFSYDVIIFGDVDLTFLTERMQQALREFVNSKSGGLMLIAGADHNPLKYRGTPLEDLLPIELAPETAYFTAKSEEESFRPQLTIDGWKGSSIFRFTDNELDDRQVWNNLPRMYWALEGALLKRGAVAFAVLPPTDATGDESPLIAMHRYGSGKVLFHGTDETWRWRFRVGDLYLGRYWVQAIRYLSRSKLLGRDRGAELTTDRREYERGTPVQFRANFLDDRLISAPDTKVTVVVQQQGGPQREIELKRLPRAPVIFEGSLPQTVAGTYHAFISSPPFEEAPPSVDFRVVSPLGEMRTVKMDVSELTNTAKITSGAYHSLTDIDDLVAAIPAGHPVPLETEEPKQLWNFWLTLAAFAGLLCTEWILRKRLRLL